MLPQDGAAMVYSERAHYHAVAEESNLGSSRRGCSSRPESAKCRLLLDPVNTINKWTWNSLPMNLGSWHDSALLESWPEQSGAWQCAPGQAVSEPCPSGVPQPQAQPFPIRWDSQLLPGLCPSTDPCTQGREQPTPKGWCGSRTAMVMFPRIMKNCHLCLVLSLVQPHISPVFQSFIDSEDLQLFAFVKPQITNSFWFLEKRLQIL